MGRRGTSNNFDDNKCSSENVKRVYVIRHGERLMYGPRVGLSCLTSCGEKRAEWLTKVFTDGADQDFCQPQAIYAFSYAYSPWSNEGDYQDCERAMQVVRPLASKLHIDAKYAANMTTLEDQCGNIQWDNEYSDDGLMAVQDKVSAQRIIDWLNANASNRVLLGAWEHINVKYLLPALGVPSSEVDKAMGMWTNAQFNSVLDLRFVQDSAGSWKYDAISFQWQGCPSEINDNCHYNSCTSDSCTSETDKED